MLVPGRGIVPQRPPVYRSTAHRREPHTQYPHHLTREEVLRRTIERQDVSVRIRNMLMAAGVTNLGMLKDWLNTDPRVRTPIEGIGQPEIQMLRDMLDRALAGI